MRHLASIQVIHNIEPIPNADKIEVVSILGWKVVVEKNKFQLYDRIIFIEIDSLLPERPEFEFMRPRKFRVKTIKLRGQISQGLCFPLSLLPPDPPNDYGWWKEGDDVTEFLGIKKYDPELFMNKGGIGAARVRTFPGFIQKTDEIRIQSTPSILSKFQGTKCYVTEKLDGSSFTIFSWDDKVGVCSRNMLIDNVPENADNYFLKQALKLNLFEIMSRDYFKGFAIQGELIGPKIQHNRYGLVEQELRLFSVFDISKQEYCGLEKLKIFSTKLSIPLVPTLDENFILQHSVDELITIATGTSRLNNQTLREGIVVRSVESMVHPCRELSHFSFKVINPEFLLKYQE
jgi:RNA ligase (TIGR02306 family)